DYYCQTWDSGIVSF
nr:immunoglobulin light chain junction region [Macaca mulatta]MOW04367.1 immunoglobulin light chain junction region [Macaca mulatta]MOW04966.1 immunoglobulin light chain junction region [Macaca mulatta]